MLRGGRNHDFFKLSQNLRNTSLGLIGFWIGYNLLTGLAPLLMTMQLDANSGYEYDWDPLDTDVILLILGIALFAVSHAIHRAWMVEEENKQFL